MYINHDINTFSNFVLFMAAQSAPGGTAVDRVVQGY